MHATALGGGEEALFYLFRPPRVLSLSLLLTPKSLVATTGDQPLPRLVSKGEARTRAAGDPVRIRRPGAQPHHGGHGGIGAGLAGLAVTLM
jgi:hypothetical protein